ncbi:MAG TPA: hypothetical protein PLQ97_07355 [Myxococcota bacterium]|nr:hypothetical protein [Myxococcota bacterium]HQK50451.1 hypothetical protein [Myxococcota bacterium]
MPRILLPVMLAVLAVLWQPRSATSQCPSGDKYISNTCVTITATGCCNDADHVRYCYNGVLCERYCVSDWCGWSSSRYTCTSSQTSDPSGAFPRPCPCDCSGKECGDDGCGGSCGTCTATYQWECRQGICVCTRDCTNRQCGSDGCGGSCGTCPTGKVCSRNQCIDKPCTPACVERVCGSDKCGGSCGTCPPDEECNEYNGQCVGAACTPNCANRQCGDDSCGGSCGDCPNGFSCDASGVCRPGTCQPACQGRECGPDGCGGSCGDCPEDKVCDVGPGTCTVPACLPACQDRQCGDDGCGGVCGVCRTPEVCTQTFQCLVPCEPRCADRQCGDDGCGGSCGTCGEGLYCDENHRCRAGTPPDPGPGEDAAPDPGDRGSPGEEEDQGGTTPPPVTCPPGTVLRYGSCVPAETGGGKSGCALSGRSSGSWTLTLVPLVALAATRRRRRA